MAWGHPFVDISRPNNSRELTPHRLSPVFVLHFLFRCIFVPIANRAAIVNLMAFAAKFAKKGLAMQLTVEEPSPAAVSFNVTDSGTFCTLLAACIDCICSTCSFTVITGTGDGAICISADGISGLPSTFTLSDLDDVCELGRGTCSIVRRVRHRASNTDLALKPISIGDKEHRFSIRDNFLMHARSAMPR